MKKVVLFSGIIIIFIISYTLALDGNLNLGCINRDLIDKEPICTTEYNPVCGCNNRTYSNACFATANGVTSWEKGACNSLKLLKK